ncbi:MAG TPA: hypothetical protein VFW64_12125 [Pseudonocardiaceae bacterium]|nr:hypothetical protein [Pseudonocardiaceae bacterium]
MTTVPGLDPAVEAAAIEAVATAICPGQYCEAHSECREDAERAVAAALPHLRAQTAYEIDAIADPLEAQLGGYLAARGHSLSTAALSGTGRLRSQAEYVLGEARELRDAVDDAARQRPDVGDDSAGWWPHARHELADVVLAAAVLARYLDTTVEQCIAEKTEADRGRG